MERRHLVAVWNPVYGNDVMEVHLRVLLDRVKALRQGHCTEDEVYVWWAKIRSPHRQEKMPHLQDVLAIETEPTRNDPDEETLLYVTDYRSLYVGHLGRITASDPREDESEKLHVPTYYLRDALHADCWFKLWDLRRLVADDTVSVVHTLQGLRNVRYHDQPVSIYGGMVDPPLIVTDTVPTRYFDPEYRVHLTDGRFWVEFDAERAGIGTMERELRGNLFGDYAWHRFDPATRSFIATAEKVFRDHADDSAFDLSPVVVELSKAVEVMCATVLRPVLAKAPPEVLAHVPADCDPGRWKHPPSLTGIAGMLEGSPRVREFLRTKLRYGDWIVGSLPAILKQFADVRNEVAHARGAGRAEVVRWRQQMVGIGQVGVLTMLAQVEAKA